MRGQCVFAELRRPRIMHSNVRSVNETAAENIGSYSRQITLDVHLSDVHLSILLNALYVRPNTRNYASRHEEMIRQCAPLKYLAQYVPRITALCCSVYIINRVIATSCLGPVKSTKLGKFRLVNVRYGTKYSNCHDVLKCDTGST